MNNYVTRLYKISRIKGPFHDQQPHLPIFLQKSLRFLHQQKPLGTQYLCAKYFFANCLFIMSIYYYYNSKTCLTLKRNLRID